MSIGYFCLPRSLTRDPLWIDLPSNYKIVFITILDHVCFKSRKFDDHGHLIELLPGQFCASFEEISKLCGKWINKKNIEHAILKLKKYGFLGQEVRHKKSIITIKHKETYELILKASETTIGTNLGQTWDKLGTEKKNDKNDKNEKKEYSPIATSLLTDFYSSLLLSRPKHNPDKMKKTSNQFFAIEKLLKKHSEEIIKKVIEFSHSDLFWRDYVHTPVYLEKKFETLISQMESKGILKDNNKLKKDCEEFCKNLSSSQCEIKINEKGIQFIPFSPYLEPIFLKFSDNGFSEQMNSNFIKFQFEKPKPQEKHG